MDTIILVVRSVILSVVIVVLVGKCIEKVKGILG